MIDGLPYSRLPGQTNLIQMNQIGSTKRNLSVLSQILARYECQYRIVGSNGRSWGEPWDDLDGGDDQSDENNLSPCARTRRVLTLWERDNEINS